MLLLGQGRSCLLYPAAKDLLVFQRCTSNQLQHCCGLHLRQPSVNEQQELCLQPEQQLRPAEKKVSGFLGANAAMLLAFCESAWRSLSTHWIGCCYVAHTSCQQCSCGPTASYDSTRSSHSLYLVWVKTLPPGHTG